MLHSRTLTTCYVGSSEHFFAYEAAVGPSKGEEEAKQEAAAAAEEEVAAEGEASAAHTCSKQQQTGSRVEEAAALIREAVAKLELEPGQMPGETDGLDLPSEDELKALGDVIKKLPDGSQPVEATINWLYSRVQMARDHVSNILAAREHGLGLEVQLPLEKDRYLLQPRDRIVQCPDKEHVLQVFRWDYKQTFDVQCNRVHMMNGARKRRKN